MRAPGRNLAVKRGRSFALDAASRYSVTTVASETSTVIASWTLNDTSWETPAASAAARALAINPSSMSMPTPRAPYFRAAAITIRPSPHPMSYTTSDRSVRASASMRSTTSGWCGDERGKARGLSMAGIAEARDCGVKERHGEEGCQELRHVNRSKFNASRTLQFRLVPTCQWTPTVCRERALDGAEVLKQAVFWPVPVEVSGASGLYS